VAPVLVVVVLPLLSLLLLTSRRHVPLREVMW
jgi:hypothetical protein